MFNYKEAKANARAKVKQHYVIFIITLLLASFIGSGYASSLSSIRSENTSIELADAVTIYELMTNQDAKADDLVDTIKDSNEKTDKKIGQLEIGYTNGVLAGVANSVTSGSVFVIIYTAITSLLGDGDIWAKVGIVIAAILMSLGAIFIRDSFRITYKRIFLEGYNYKEVKTNRFAFLFKVHKVVKATITTLITEIFTYLWFATIVGGPINVYAYSQVHYITAENPDISPMQAIKLSRRMMKGHKWELFKYEFPFVLWLILDTLTLGLSGILFSNAYYEAFKVEYYVYVRKLAIDNKLEGYELLNDKYLYENAPEELLNANYADVLANKEIEVTYPEIKGFKGFLAHNFGIVLKYDEVSEQYHQAMVEEYEYELYKDIFHYEDYPTRLCPNKEPEGKKKELILAANRQYALTTIVLIFFIFSLIGWLWEVSLHLVNDGTFVNRGVLHGPWLPVYGSGVCLILLILYRFRKNITLEFFSAIVLCGFVEYFTSLYLELTKGMRWWDYSGYFLNLDGRICAEGLLVFGLGGIAAVYLVAPLIDNRLRKVKPVILTVLSVVLLVCFVGDSIYSKDHPNTGKGITDYDTTAYVLIKDKIC